MKAAAPRLLLAAAMGTMVSFSFSVALTIVVDRCF